MEASVCRQLCKPMYIVSYGSLCMLLVMEASVRSQLCKPMYVVSYGSLCT